MRTRLASVGLAAALFAAACGGGDERPDLPISLGAGGAREAAAADSALGASAAEMSMAIVEYDLDAETSNLPQEGPAYEVKARASEDDVRDLGETLGLDGNRERGERGEWYLSGDGGALLTVEPVSGSPWYFQAEGACGPGGGVSSDGGRIGCGDVAVSSPVEEPASGEVTPGCKPQPDGTEICEAPAPIEPERPANLPSKREAETTARALLEKLDVDLDDASVRVEDGFSAWYVSVEPRIDGLKTYGFGWSVTVGPDNEIQSASGHLGDPAKVADYPLIEVGDAIDELQSQFAAVTDIAVDCSDTASAEGAGTQALCADAPPAQPQVQRITAVELGLVWSPSYTDDGPGYLTPAWVLTIEDGGEMPVNALSDEYVQQPPDQPVPEPVPADGGGADGREPAPAQTEPAPAPDQPAGE